MELIFVGTSSGRTSLKRHHSSFCFIDQGKATLIDIGDGICKALLAQKIESNCINEIIISHNHADHLAGLPSLLTQMIIEKRTAPLQIFTHTKLVSSLQLLLQTSYIFIEKLKFEVQIVAFDFEQSISLMNNITFLAKQNSHVTNKHNIDLENIKFVSSSFLFKYVAKNIIYTSDIGSYEDLFLFQEIATDIIITEATHIPLSKIEDAITILNPKKVILTHIDNEEEITVWHNKLTAEKKQNITIAEDGMRVKI